MKKYLFLGFSLIFVIGCQPLQLIPPAQVQVEEKGDKIRFAAFGDYGDSGLHERKVSKIVKDFAPEFIITVGDNNYPNGKRRTIKKNIGRYYSDYIYNPDAPKRFQCKGKASDTKKNMFFPSLGNHDYQSPNGNLPYLNYFTLPNNEVYYDFVWGPVHFYSLDSDLDMEEQKAWFYEQLALSTQPFNIIYFHHSPYSTGMHGNEVKMQWDFSGVDIVMTGHDHIYERHIKVGDSAPMYIVNGLGGRDKRKCHVHPLEEGQFESIFYDETYGAMTFEVDEELLKGTFINLKGDTIDAFEIRAEVD